MKKAFTLIELLVVVAIIGILATVVIINTSSARKKSQDAKAKSDLGSAQRAAAMCVADKATVSLATNTAPTVGTAICSGQVGWPNLAVNQMGTGTTNWGYTATGTAYSSSAGTFTFIGSNTTIVITCKVTGCTSN